MATEAEIIPEPVSLVKTEEESKQLSMELCDKAAEVPPTETDECLAKAEKMEVAASNNGVETLKTVSGSNPEISKGESFSISPEISKAANESCAMAEHKEVDDTPFKAEMIPEDEEKLAIDQKLQLQEEANLELKKHDPIDSPGSTIDSLKKDNETVAEASNSNLVQEEGIEAIKPIETSGTQKDQMVSDGNGYTLTSTAAESSENKDHQTSSELLDSKKCSESNEALENKQDGVQKELKDSTFSADKEDSLEKEIEKKEPEKEVCKPSETAASRLGKENPDMEEHPIADISNSSISDENVKEGIEKVDVVPAAETEETSVKEAEVEEVKKGINDVLSVEHEEIGVGSTCFDLKQEESSVTHEKDKEIPLEEEGMQDKVSNAGSEDQMETTAKVIPLKEVMDDEVKEHSAMPSKEITDETSEKHQVPYEKLETPLSQATDEISMQKEDDTPLDVPKADEIKEHLAQEPNVHAEQESEKGSSVSDVSSVSNGEKPREIERPADACEEKTLQSEQSSDSGLETVKIEEGKALDEATDLGEAASTCKDDETTIQENENLAKNMAKPESLKEDTELEKEETELATGVHDQVLEKIEEEIQRVPKAISEEETIGDQGLQKEEPEEQIQTTSPAVPSEEREHVAGAITEDLEYGKTKEEVTEKLDAVAGEEIAGEQILSVNKQEEGTASTTLLSKELEGEKISEVEETEEEKIKEAEIPDKISEDSSDTKITTEICLESKEIQELEGAKKDETAAAEVLQVEEPNEKSLTTPSAQPSADQEHGITANVNKVEEEKAKEVEVLGKERPQEPDAVVDSSAERALPKEEISYGQTFSEEKPDEQLHISSSAIASEVLEQESQKAEDEKTKKEETIKAEIQEDASDVKTTEERSIQLEAVAEDETTADHTLTEKKQEEQIPNRVVTLPSDEHEPATINEVDKSVAEEVFPDKDDTRGPQAVPEGETIASQVVAEDSQEHGTLGEENKIKEAETLEDEISPQSECPRELQGAIEDGAAAAQALPGEKPVDQLHIRISTLPSEVQEDETKETNLRKDNTPEKNQEKIIENEGNEIILNEVSEEEAMADKEVTEKSCLIPHSEELTKGGYGEEELKDKPAEDKTNEALETQCQAEEQQVVDAQKTSANEIIEKHIVSEDKTVEDPGQASVPGVETETVKEEESSSALSQGEGTKDIAEGNEIITDMQEPEETANIASDEQIPREFDPIGKENVPIELHDRVAETSQKADSGDVKEIHPKEVEHAGEGNKIITDMQEPEETANIASDEQIPREFDPIGKENVPIELQDRVAETSQKADSGDVKEIHPKEVEHAGEETKDNSADHVETSTKETLEVNRDMIEAREAKDEPEEKSPAPSSKLLSEEEHGVSTEVDAAEEKEQKQVEENKELKPVVEQEIVAVQAPATENIEKDIVADDKTVKDLEQASVQLPVQTEQKDRASESSNKPEVGDLEPGKAQDICSEARVEDGEEKRTGNSGMEITQEPESVDSSKLSLSDLLQSSTEEKVQVVERVIEEGKVAVGKEEPHVEESENIHVKEAITDEEKEEGEEQNKADSGSDAPVMVEAPRDTDSKPHKKSHNILSGVGSKVKHSISKVKKAITGKSSHSKESKPISPKGSEK